jgi:hypothetical protein
MARAANPYTKLARRGLRRVAFGLTATRCQLWLGADHLLAVDSTIATEEYRRFYFRDIEAIVIRCTADRKVWNWIMGVLAVMTVAPFFIGWRSNGITGLLVTSICLTIFWSVFIAINSLRGATCQTHIRTAAQTEQLPSLGRLPVARKALARLQPLILAAQGEAPREELAAAPWMAPDSGR